MIAILFAGLLIALATYFMLVKRGERAHRRQGSRKKQKS